MRLKGRVAIVTGAANGIGRAIALCLSREGANVVVADVDVEHSREVVGQINTLGGKATAMKVDVTKTEDTDRMVKTTLDEFGKIDILVNTAGGPVREGMADFTHFHELPEKACNATINLNLGGVLNCCRSVARHMMERGGGKIVNIASIAGVIGSSGMTDYSAAKAGVIGFTKALAKELAVYRINVNCISPGAIDHPGTPKTGESWQRQKQTIHLRRFGEPDDIADTVVFLASDEASYIVGQNISVCGGRSLGGLVEKDW
jgi:NAD(P)-dependent dehydrogenase (short-subunit alcohol dehydrogenase family)